MPDSVTRGITEYERGFQDVGQGRINARCRSLALPMPGTYEELEQRTIEWIASCVQSRTVVDGEEAHRERQLVPGHESLRSVWGQLAGVPLGASVTIEADYIWKGSHVDRIQFSPGRIEKRTFTFETEEVVGSRPDQMPTRDDVTNGEYILFGSGASDAIVPKMADLARRFQHLDRSAFVDILKGIELAEKGLVQASDIFETEFLAHLGEAEGQVTATWGAGVGEVIPPVAMALGLVLALVEIGEANETREIAARRLEYYRAFANGIAAGLDSSYREGVPSNAFLRSLFDYGLARATRLTRGQKQNVRAYLIMSGSPPRTPEEYRLQLDGKVFFNRLMDIFEQPVYLIRDK